MGFTSTKTVIIGGSSGIGYATAENIIEAGGEVIIAARDDERRETAAAELGPNATEWALDITNRPELDNLFAENPVDYLVCTPAYIPQGFDINEQELRTAFDVKFFGYYKAAQAARETLSDDGAIVFMSGEAGVDPNPEYFAVGVVNAAVECLTQYLALEYAPIRVSAISPNAVDTYGLSEETRANLAEEFPLNRVADPDDIAEAICFALQNPNFTGEVIRINGGAGVA